jgi:hypothetical protein
MLTPERSGGRRHWLLIAGGLGVAGLIVVTAVVALSSKDPSASNAVTTGTPSTAGATVGVAVQPSSVSSSVLLPGGPSLSTWGEAPAP